MAVALSPFPWAYLAKRDHGRSILPHQRTTFGSSAAMKECQKLPSSTLRHLLAGIEKPHSFRRCRPGEVMHV